MPILVLLGCGRPEFTVCEELIENGLRSPATYQLARLETFDEPITKQQLTSIGGRSYGDAALTLRKVFIEYDAANAYGTPIRGAEMCAFVLREGKLPSST